MTTTTLTRPNGKTYRARKPGLHVQCWDDECDGGDAGVIVFGTLNIDEATEAAKAAVRQYFGVSGIENAYPSWFRSSYRDGRSVWVADAERGRPGVCFTAVDL